MTLPTETEAPLLDNEMMSWPSRSSRRIVSSMPRFIAEAEYLKRIPEWLRRGPARPSAKLWLAVTWLALFAAAPWCAVAFPTSAESPRDPHWLAVYRWVGAVGGTGLFAYIARHARIRWCLASFTMQSFALLTLRFLLAASSAACGGHDVCAFSRSAFIARREEDKDTQPREETDTRESPCLARVRRPLRFLAVAVRFPALAQATVTFSIWWFALSPIILVALKDTPAELNKFVAFSLSPVLLLVHFFNLPLAGLEFVFSGEKLSLFDLWMAIFCGIAYLTFYLAVLDANDVHFYIILSPRTHAAPLVYTLLALSFVGLYAAWNALIRVISP